MTTDTIVLRNPETLSADVAGELVLLHLASGKYYGLDEVASSIWQQLEKPVGVGRLCEQLSETYDGDAHRIEREVLALLTLLESDGLVLRQDEPRAP